MERKEFFKPTLETESNEDDTREHTQKTVEKSLEALRSSSALVHLDPDQLEVRPEVAEQLPPDLFDTPEEFREKNEMLKEVIKTKHDIDEMRATDLGALREKRHARQREEENIAKEIAKKEKEEDDHKAA